MRHPKRSITELARELRSNPTPSEKWLWEKLKKRRFHGLRFVRQKPLIYRQVNHTRYFFIADFYCPELKLVLELDGKIHEFQKEYDVQRDVVIRQLKIKVLRIQNEELVNWPKVEKKILNYGCV